MLNSSLYASDKIVEHVKLSTDKFISKFVRAIEEKLKSNDKTEVQNFIETIESIALLKSKSLKKDSKFIEPIEIRLGELIKNKKKYHKKMFTVDLEKTIQQYLGNNQLEQIMKFEKSCEKFVVKLALYHDEICIANPLGNFNSFNVLKCIKRHPKILKNGLWYMAKFSIYP